MNSKPILFNTDMVRAILGNRKTMTRRVVKERELIDHPPYRPGDILYVRETWRAWRARRYEADIHIEFKAGGEGVALRFPHGCTDSVNRDEYDNFFKKWGVGAKWHPSIHMPREAARIFLKVTDVRAERLWEIDGRGILAEGIDNGSSNPAMGKRFENMQRMAFQRLWNSTIKKADRALYGWAANPWVWVIEFERINGEDVKKWRSAKL